MKRKIFSLLCGMVLLAGCSQHSAQGNQSGGGGGTIEAINHTKWAIEFSVNGQSGLDVIGPHQGGGGGCCFGVPKTWQPGMMVRVDWKTSVAFASIDVPEIPGPKRPDYSKLDKHDVEGAHRLAMKYSEEYRAWRVKIEALSRTHTKMVPVPDYTGQGTCGITVHFMPCNQVKVTTSCADYGNPGYPIKEPLEMQEPKVCPKS